MRKKIIIMLVAIVMVFSLSLATISPARADNGKEEAIAKGLEWLAAQQDDTTGAWNLDYYPVASTAFAVLKFEHHAKKILEIDPFDDTYTYKANIVAGLKYIFEHAVCVDINDEPADNPDVNLVNGMGVYFMSPAASEWWERPMYETGIVMMALEASCHPEFEVDVLLSCVHNWTYLDVMKDTVDYVAWAQNDEPNPGRGGWRYGAYDDGTISGPGLFPDGKDSDNSVSQWPVLGLMAAEAWDVYAPDWVGTELENHWLAYSQSFPKPPGNGGFGYTDNTGPNIALTASGLTQLTYCGVTTDDPRWGAAAQWICENWGGFGDLYSMYGVMKAAMTAQPEIIWDFCGHMWQEEYDEWLIANQVLPDGYWTGGYGPDGGRLLATEWALLILQKVIPPITRLALAPESDVNMVGTTHTLTATLTRDGEPIPDETLTFEVTAGPHIGATGTDTTNDAGEATWSYRGITPGDDTIVATGAGETSNEAYKTWEVPPPPAVPTVSQEQ